MYVKVIGIVDHDVGDSKRQCAAIGHSEYLGMHGGCAHRLIDENGACG
jgi:hypothetical protein